MKRLMPMSRLHRAARSGLAGAALAAALAAASLPAVAADPLVDASPDAMIMSLTSEVLDVIRHDKAIQAGDVERVQTLVDERILPRVDFDRMTRLAVGRAWRTE